MLVLEQPGLGPAILRLPEGAPLGLVAILPDVDGADGRPDRYADALLARGIATLAAQDGGLPASWPDGVHLAGRMLGLAPGQLGLLGFGAGARAGLLAGLAMPQASIYPGCAGLEASAAAAPVLLLHGSADPAEPVDACRRLAARLGPATLLHTYYGATHAWDFTPGPHPGMRSLVPDPADPARRRMAVASPEVTADAARRVAEFFAATLSRGPAPTPVSLASDR